MVARQAVGAILNDHLAENGGQVRVFEFMPVSTTDIDINSGIKIFPNPATEIVQITGIENAWVRITDNLGRTVLQKAETSLTSDVSYLVSNLAIGKL